MDAVNHQCPTCRPPRRPPAAERLELHRGAVGEPGDGEVLVKIRYLSLDPAMRGWMNDGRSYIPPVGIGEVMRAFGVGEVIASNDPDHRGRRPRRRACSACRSTRSRTAGRCSRSTRRMAPLPVYLGALGMPGVTAYFGLLDIGRPQAGRHGRRLGRGRRGRRRCRPDREAEGLPRGRDRGRRREVPATSSRSSASTRRSTTRPRMSARRSPSTARTGSTCTSTTSAARSSTRRSRTWRGTRGWSSAGRSRSTTPPARCSGPSQLPVAARQPREHDRLRDVRLSRPLRRGGHADGRLAGGGQADRARGRRGGAWRTSRTRCCGCSAARTHGKLVLKIASDSLPLAVVDDRPSCPTAKGSASDAAARLRQSAYASAGSSVALLTERRTSPRPH